MCSHTVIIEVCGNLQSGIADRIERKNRHIKIQNIRIIAVDNIQRTVVEVRHKFLRRHTGTVSPRPLTMYRTVIPTVFAHRVVLCIKVLRVVTLPPFSFTVCFSQLSIVRYAFFRPDCIVALSGLIPCPCMVGMQADTKRKTVFTGCLLPFSQYVTLRPHIYRVPRLVLAVPKVEIIMMIAQCKEILRTYLLIESHQRIRIPMFSLK